MSFVQKIKNDFFDIFFGIELAILSKFLIKTIQNTKTENTMYFIPDEATNCTVSKSYRSIGPQGDFQRSFCPVCGKMEEIQFWQYNIEQDGKGQQIVETETIEGETIRSFPGKDHQEILKELAAEIDFFDSFEEILSNNKKRKSFSGYTGIPGVMKLQQHFNF